MAGLHAAGSGPLAAPPSAEGIPAWVQTRDPLIASFALVRLLALAMGYYLLLVTLAGTAFRLTRMARLTAATDLLTIAAVRRVLDGCIGLALMAAVSTPSASIWCSSGRSFCFPLFQLDVERTCQPRRDVDARVEVVV